MSRSSLCRSILQVKLLSATTVHRHQLKTDTAEEWRVIQQKDYFMYSENGMKSTKIGELLEIHNVKPRTEST